MTVSAPRIYFQLPAFMQDLAVTAMGATHRWRRTDPMEQARWMAFLASSERWSAEQFADWQSSQLRLMIADACANVPFWQDAQREHGFAPDDFRTLADLSRLPLLTKNKVRAKEEAFAHSGVSGRDTVHLNTSGTTGSPLAVRYTRKGFARKWACVARLRQWHGVRRSVAPRRVQITGSVLFDVDREERRPWRWNLAARTMLVPVNAISTRLAPQILAAIGRLSDVEVMDGYPSAIAHLADLGRSLGIRGPRVPVIVTTAERLIPEQRRLIAEYFSARVVDQYSASDPSIFMGECENGSLHLFPQSGILELLPLPGEDATREHVARIVMTPFFNPAQYFFRYAIGDLARVLPGRTCTCGRATTIIEAIEGRAADVIVVNTADGERALTNALLSTGFYGFDEVRRGQVVQTGDATIMVRCEMSRTFSQERAAAFVDSFRRVCGAGIDVRVEMVDRIPLGPNGKFQSVVPRIREREQ